MSDATKKSWLARVPIVGERLADRIQGVPTVAVIRLTGVIGQMAPVRRGGLTLADQAETIEKAFKLPRAKAVAVAVNSPGGSPVQSALIAGRLRALSEENKIPVYAFCEDVTASGGYWLACAADEIWVDANTIIGSIGVIFASFGFHDLLTRHGVERRVHTAGESKAMLDPFQPEKEEDIARLTRMQEAIHANFKDHVRRARGAKLADGLFTGEVWVGAEAVENGLADGVGHLAPIMAEKLGAKPRFRVYGPRKSLFSRLGAPGAAELAQVVEDRALWARFGL